MACSDNRILVVDDELGMREGCSDILNDKGYEVLTAEDGLAGLEAFRTRGPFGAVIADLKMPRMSGLDLVERIRELDPDVVIFMITAYATIDTAVEATKRGAYGYIPKPFTPAELLLHVRQGLERRSLALEARRLREERERRLIEVALEKSNSRTIISCMTDGVLVINRDREIVMRNAAAARIFPAFSQIPIPAPLACIDSPALLEIAEASLEAGQDPTIMSKEILAGECAYLVNASPVGDLGEEARGAVVVLRDITALKHIETSKSMFISMVAHELKSPLTAVEGYLDVILSGMAGEIPEKVKTMMTRALVRARGVHSLVSDLLSMTALETGRFDLKRVPLDLREVIQQVIELSKDKASSKGIELSLDVQEGFPIGPTLADKDAMVMVFSNLIDNAIKYTPEKGHVWVQVRASCAHILATVKDDGIGMSPDDSRKIFDEFYRVKNKFTASVPGTGLGLSLVKRLLDLHHGRITIQTALGQGSAFTVSLPFAGHEG